MIDIQSSYQSLCKRYKEQLDRYPKDRTSDSKILQKLCFSFRKDINIEAQEERQFYEGMRAKVLQEPRKRIFPTESMLE